MKRRQRERGKPKATATADAFEVVIEMSRHTYVVLCILVVTVGIVLVDLLFLRHHFLARLLVNIGIVQLPPLLVQRRHGIANVFNQFAQG